MLALYQSLRLYLCYILRSGIGHKPLAKMACHKPERIAFLIPKFALEICLGLPRRARLNPVGFNLSALRADFAIAKSGLINLSSAHLHKQLTFPGSFWEVKSQNSDLLCSAPSH